MGISSVVDKLWLSLVELLFPLKCVGCGHYGEMLCSNCQKQVVPLLTQTCIGCTRVVAAGYTSVSCQRSYRADRLVCLYPYRGWLRTLLLQFKYRDGTAVKSVLAKLLVDASEQLSLYLPSGALLLPIPLHSARLKQRGFNQAAVIATELGAIFGCKVREDLLRRVRPTSPQRKLNHRADKVANVKGAFAYTGQQTELLGRLCVVVDDIYTSGATVKEAVKVLKQAGAEQVWVLCLARGRFR